MEEFRSSFNPRLAFRSHTLRLPRPLPPQWQPEITHHCPKTPWLLVGTQNDLRSDQTTVQKVRPS